MSGIESLSSFSAHMPATEKFASIRRQISENVRDNTNGKFEEKLQSAGVSVETRAALLADVKQVIQRQISAGTRPDPSAMRERVGEVFKKHGLRLPDGLQQQNGGLSVLSGYPDNVSANGSAFDVAQSLFEHTKAGRSRSRDYESSANQFASDLVDEYIRFDVEA